ncbi:hypothetical protein ACFQU7_41720 [Pseudoroseomonas wenyumeiae]
MRLALWCSAACAALALLAAPTKAEIIYTFTQTAISSPADNRFTFSAKLILADEAENGFDLNLQVNPRGGTTSYTANNVLDFVVNFYTATSSSYIRTWDINDMLSFDAPGRSVQQRYIVTLAGDGSGMNGSLFLNDTNQGLIFRSPATASPGRSIPRISLATVATQRPAGSGA